MKRLLNKTRNLTLPYLPQPLRATLAVRVYQIKNSISKFWHGYHPMVRDEIRRDTEMIERDNLIKLEKLRRHIDGLSSN